MTPIFYLLILISCLIVNINCCGYPGSPPHAIVSFTSDSIKAGTVATYTCDNGYELLGPPRRTCLENGTWVPQGVPFCGELSLFRFYASGYSVCVCVCVCV